MATKVEDIRMWMWIVQETDVKSVPTQDQIRLVALTGAILERVCGKYGNNM